MPELINRQFLSQKKLDDVEMPIPRLLTAVFGKMLQEYHEAHGHWDMLSINVTDSLDTELELPPGLVISLEGWKNESE